ncbi:MAG TPA: hypothetical protein VM597_07555 [Gemmataceae bacterium]|jgi:hypothetical protein|nr:hypothetical protein [Gemmataceae bacterium]
MNLPLTPACPKCGFTYGWVDGRCCHCQYAGGPLPAPAPVPAEKPGRPARFVWELAILVGFLILAVLGGLIALANFSERAHFLGIEDFTRVYLIGSVVVGLVEVAAAGLVVRHKGRWTGLSLWLVGVTVVWIPVSVGVAAHILPNSVSLWFPLTYLGFFFLQIPGALWYHWDRVKRLAFRGEELTPDELPPDSVSATVVYGAFYAAFAVAGGVLAVVLWGAGHRVDDALEEMSVELDRVEVELQQAEGAPPGMTGLKTALAAAERHAAVAARIGELLDRRLTRRQADRLKELFSRATSQRDRTRDLSEKAMAAIAERKKASGTADRPAIGKP